MSQAQDQRFFRNTALVIDVLAAVILIFFTLTQITGCDKETSPAQSDTAVAERTVPEGQVRIAGQTTDTAAPSVAATADAASAAAAPDTAEDVAAGGDDTGKRVYNSLCFTCHGNVDGSGGLPNIPHFGDKAAWTDRIAQGMPLLYEHAIKGFTGASGMPMMPKGGNPNLTDDEVRAAVDFMLANIQ